MNYYETLYIVHPALESGRLKDIIVNIEDSLKKLGGKSLAIELWGRRKLSYFIDKQKYGTYVLFQYNAEGNCTNKLSIELEHNPNILAYLTTVIDSNDVLSIEEDLEVQIAGKTREVEKSGTSENKEDQTNIEESLNKDEDTEKEISKENSNKETSQDVIDEISTNDDKVNQENPDEQSAENIEE